MRTFIRVSLFAFAALALAACQPTTNTNTTSNTNTNTAPKAAAPTAESLMALDQKAWDAFKAKDGQFFNTFLADNFVGLDNGKRQTKAETVKYLSEHKCDIKSASFSEPKVTMAGADAAVLTYKGTFDGSCADDKGATQKMPSPMTIATVFVRSGDTWKGAYHNEVTIIEPPTPANGANSNAAANTSKAEPPKVEKKEVTASPAAKEDKAAPNATANTAAASNSNTSSNTNAAGGSDALTDAIMAVEKKGWESWMKGDVKGMEETTSKDVVFVDITGKATFGQAEVIKAWTTSDCKITSVDVSDGKASMITSDAAILTFKGTAVGTCGDMKMEPLWGTTVAIKDGNSWKAVYIFETPIQKM